MDKRIRFIDTETGEEIMVTGIVDGSGFTHLPNCCELLFEADAAIINKNNTDWNQMRRDMIREMMFARYKDSALDLPWKVVASKVGALVDAFIAEMQKGAHR